MIQRLILALFLTVSVALPSFAQGPGASQESLARTLRDQGVAAARNGNWAEAQGLFQRSYDLDPRVLTLYNLAAAQTNTGSLVEADENFRRFLATAPAESLAQFRTEAQRLRAELAQRIPRLTLQIPNLHEGDTVQINGTDFAHGGLGVPVPVNPGAVNIVVSRAGAPVGNESMQVSESQIEVVTVDVPAYVAPEIDPAQVAANSQQSSGQNSAVVGEGPGEAEDESSNIGVIIGVVVGVIVIGAAIGVGVAVSSQEDPFVGDFNLDVM